MKTFMKHAPMWTLGVGGSPLDVALAGELLLSSFFFSTLSRGGGIGGSPAVRSGRPTPFKFRPSVVSKAAESLSVLFVWRRRGEAWELGRNSTLSAATEPLVSVASSREVSSSVSPENELWRRLSKTEQRKFVFSCQYI